MNKDEKKLTEQEAPEKNGDGAFVQVGADGKPVMPAADDADDTIDTNPPKQGASTAR